MNKKLTYFTPTYNRGGLLERLYNSLLQQTNQNFIWLIIDDGSKDNTKEIVKQWIADNKIAIKYHYKENGGKHTAIDLSNQLCETEYICCVDSDDWLTVDSTDVILNYINKYKTNKEIVGFVGRRANPDMFASPKWPKQDTQMYFYELLDKYGYTNETVLVFRCDIIKNFHFPIFKGERFVTESVFYNQFMYDYQMITMNKCIYLGEYKPDGYTMQGLDLFFKNPKGFIYAYKQSAYLYIKYHKGFKSKIIKCATYYAWKSALKIKDEFKQDYKIKFPYNLFGWLLQIKLSGKYKNKYKEFLDRQRGK